MFGQVGDHILLRPGLESRQQRHRTQAPGEQPDRSHHSGRGFLHRARIVFLQRPAGEGREHGRREHQGRHPQQPLSAGILQDQPAEQRPGKQTELPKKEKIRRRSGLAPLEDRPPDQGRLHRTRRVKHPRPQPGNHQQYQSRDSGNHQPGGIKQSHPQDAPCHHPARANPVGHIAKHRLDERCGNHIGCAKNA